MTGIWSATNYGTLDQLPDRDLLEYYGKHTKSLFWFNPSHASDHTDEAESDAAPVIRMVLKIPPMPITYKPREVLTIDMISSEILNYLSQSRGLGEYFIIQQDGHNLLSDQRLSRYEGVGELMLETIAGKQVQEGFFTAPLNGQEMGITYRVSPFNGWIYMSIVSISEITSQSKKIAQATFLLGLMVLLVIGCLAFILSRRMYSPVRKLVEYSRDVQDEPGSQAKEDEFGLIAESLRKLSDTGKDLKLQVQKQYAQLKEFFVLKLIFGQISDQDIRVRGKHYGFPTSWTRLAVMTVQIDTLQDTRYSEKDRELLLYAVNNIVGELLPQLLEDQLIQAIKMGDMERIEEQLQQYLDAIRHKEVSFSEYPALMIQFISKLYHIVQEQGGSVNKVLGQRGSIESFMKLQTLREIEAWFRHDLIKPVIQFLNEQAETQYLNIANQMLKIIHERYEEDISLDTCAAILNYHPVYLSRVFKKEVGVNFIDYLVEYRMNVAKKWLETTDLKIANIAERLQYKNTSAFIRTFRRIAGMTPGQYREQVCKQ
jgi:Response regulator containing CheY-like receiver domain and AraC-type DNA-binding domain